jgi:hypothetical protein
MPSSNEAKELRFAHYSVQEYLMSKRSRLPFQISPEDVHHILAGVSLGYLLSANQMVPKIQMTLDSLPFLLYTSEH